MIHSICVCGAGTMGSGIAQVTAQNGFPTILFDLDATALQKAEANISNQFGAMVTKQKMKAEEKEKALANIRFSSDMQSCLANLIIEAIVEKTPAKIALFNKLAEINPAGTIFATNTSSLSVSEIASGVRNPERVAGLHFFNPAPLMKLVEVVRTKETSNEVIDALMNLAGALHKIPVLCKDSPGFIVNRVARHYYLEALRLAEEEGIAYSTIDDLMEATGFRMGPFRLMDLIGNDINLAVSQSVYHALGDEPRLAPSGLQAAKVDRGELGRKSGKGYYEY